MPKRPKQSYPEFDDEFDDESEVFDDNVALLGTESAFTEEDIEDICGATNAAQGLTLYQNGAVTQPTFDGTTLRAAIRDNAGIWNVEFDTLDEGSLCDFPAHRRRRGMDCEHIAALLYAFIREPRVFMPQTMGGVVNLLEQNPDLLAQLGVNRAEFESTLQMLKNAPPGVREALDKLSLDQVANLEQMPQLLAAQREAELKALLEGLSVVQLRELANRRGWNVKSSVKSELVTSVSEQLHTAPAPAEFSPEEEQLLRFENTLYGFENVPTQNELSALWKKRGGGDMARLERALRGLQNAGLLFACTREAGPPHYHWSPFLDSAKLPLVHPKVVLATSEQVRRLQLTAPSLPFLAWVDAALEFVQREPLQLRKLMRDEQATRLPYIGPWEYDPQEVANLLEPRYVPRGTVEGLSVPLASPFTESSLDALSAFLQAPPAVGESIDSGEPANAGESKALPRPRDFAAWLAGMVMTNALLTADETGRVELAAPRAEEYRTRPVEEQYRRWWNLWRAGGPGELWLTLPRRGLVLKRVLMEPSFTPQSLAEEMGRARRFVARLLTRLDPLVWYDWESFVNLVHELRVDFLHSDTDDRTWWFASDSGRFKLSPHNPQHWESAYRPVLTAMFEGALHWLGAVELGYQNGKLAAFQITSAGAWLLSEGQVGSVLEQGLAAPAEEGTELIRWLDDETFRLRASGDAAPLLAAARSIADPTRELLTFRVSNAAIARAFDRGLGPAHLAQQFAEAGTPLPSAILSRLDELYLNYGRTHLYERLTVLELADDYALRELLASTNLRQHIVHQFSPRAVVIHDEAVDEFVNELVKKGYTPRVK